MLGRECPPGRDSSRLLVAATIFTRPWPIPTTATDDCQDADDDVGAAVPPLMSDIS